MKYWIIALSLVLSSLANANVIDYEMDWVVYDAVDGTTGMLHLTVNNDTNQLLGLTIVSDLLNIDWQGAKTFNGPGGCCNYTYLTTAIVDPNYTLSVELGFMSTPPPFDYLGNLEYLSGGDTNWHYYGTDGYQAMMYPSSLPKKVTKAPEPITLALLGLGLAGLAWRRSTRQAS